MNVPIIPPHFGHSRAVSSHNLVTRWVRQNFESTARRGSCNNIGKVLE